MDTLTHALSGALLARATEPGTAAKHALPRRTRLWVGFWSAAFPDSDFILSFIDPLLYITAHRGVTHSILLLPLWAVGLALLLQLAYRGRYSWRAFAGVCALGIGTHIAGDVITSYGTHILAPFSDWRAQLPVTFIIDPYFSGVLVLGIVGMRYARNSRVPAVVSLAVLVAYVGLQAVLHERAERLAAGYIAAQGVEPARAHALAQPFSPFHWMLVVEQPAGYRVSYISLVRDETPPVPDNASLLRRIYASYRPAHDARWDEVPRYGPAADNRLAMEAWDSPGFARYRQFAMLPAVFRIDRRTDLTCVWFYDLRFALMGRVGPFRYGTCRPDVNAPWKVYRLDEDLSGAQVLHAIE